MNFPGKKVLLGLALTTATAFPSHGDENNSEETVYEEVPLYQQFLDNFSEELEIRIQRDYDYVAFPRGSWLIGMPEDVYPRVEDRELMEEYDHMERWLKRKVERSAKEALKDLNLQDLLSFGSIGAEVGSSKETEDYTTHLDDEIYGERESYVRRINNQERRNSRATNRLESSENIGDKDQGVVKKLFGDNSQFGVDYRINGFDPTEEWGLRFKAKNIDIFGIPIHRIRVGVETGGDIEASFGTPILRERWNNKLYFRSGIDFEDFGEYKDSHAGITYFHQGERVGKRLDFGIYHVERRDEAQARVQFRMVF